MSKEFDKEVGARLREARQRAGLSQQDLADTLGIPRSGVSMIETGDRALASSELARLSTARGFSADELLFGEGGIERSLEDAEPDAVLRYFRAQTELDAVQERWLSAAEEQWRLYADLEQRVYGTQRFELPTYPTLSGRAFEQGERLAEQERRRLNLGSAPVRSMVGLLEGEGVKVLLRPFGTEAGAPGVSGAYFFSGDLGPCVIVNEEDQPSRRRFTEAHEYCHFLVDRRPLEGEICTLSRSREEFEMRANAFAAAFLMPVEGIAEAMIEASLRPGEAEPEDVVRLMFRFGVSYQAILWRLLNLSWISRSDRERLAAIDSPMKLAERLGYEYDPGQTEVRPDRFRRVALDAWRAKKIGSEELATAIGVPLADLDEYFEAGARHPRRPSSKLQAEPDWL
jgi:Zn-dependent peptidase ImmA (M78 family)/transcriptional regulator with XRE-family HTH domain